MAVKYTCPKCSKRFIDWGAEKLDFKCPDCTDETLVLVGHVSSQTRSAKRPSLKRATRARVKKRTPAPAVVEDEAILADVDIADGSSALLDADHDMDGESMDGTDAPPLEDGSGKTKPKAKKATKTKAKAAKAKPQKAAAKPKKSAAKSKAKAKPKAKAKAKTKPKAKKKAKK